MKINIVTYQNYFGHHLKVEESLNLNVIKKELEAKNFNINIFDINELIKYGVNDNEFYWITSHQNTAVKKYLNDIVFSLFVNREEQLITSLKLYFAHDNKGIQSLLFNNGKSIELIKQKYYLSSLSEDIDRKKVFKTIDGAGGQGVSLVDNSKIKKRVNKEKIISFNIYECKTAIKEKIKKIVKRNDKYASYVEKRVPYVLQDFIEGLDSDYKVLVFFKRVYVLKRNIRDNDFRASGSGKFSYIEPTDELLNYSLNLRENINSPFVSIDIAEVSKNKFKCIEYQATHFGPYTQLNAKYFYEKKR
ncbi:hypothetical protein UB42_01810 [Photobacterium leiognathi]|uniref:hypothetical protein n=1 Tax=Photobacterium leiognathi TaxID=553611 RepID=UPI0005D41F7A|nr:hypothetical protein [Photobacterium leiognathi]KJF91571.1 hypothetical protein UB42_01810 [Photobacterium leiognathi]